MLEGVPPSERADVLDKAVDELLTSGTCVFNGVRFAEHSEGGRKRVWPVGQRDELETAGYDLTNLLMTCALRKEQYDRLRGAK